MSILSTVLKELFGLFVDDGSLAMAILALIGAIALLAAAGLPPLLTGPLLFLGCAAIVVENVLRTVRAKRR